MLIIDRYNKHGVDFREVWYASQSCRLEGINLYRGAELPIGTQLRRARTLITDLRPPLEEIMTAFNKNTRYAIRKAQRDGITVRIRSGSEVTREDVEDFCTFFVEFWKSKGVEGESYEKYYSEAETYVRQGAFAISTAFDPEGNRVSVHTYIVGEDFVRSYQSASVIWEDRAKNAIVGRANRYLHLKDMEYFKNAGIPTYDWGGAGTDPEVAGITAFKEEFGGREHFYYDSEEVLGLKALAVKKMINIAGMIK